MDGFSIHQPWVNVENDEKNFYFQNEFLSMILMYSTNAFLILVFREPTFISAAQSSLQSRNRSSTKFFCAEMM